MYSLKSLASANVDDLVKKITYLKRETAENIIMKSRSLLREQAELKMAELAMEASEALLWDS